MSKSICCSNGPTHMVAPQRLQLTCSCCYWCCPVLVLHCILLLPAALFTGYSAPVQVTQEHNEECKKLLQLMGVPVIDAPSEAEAQCAAMAKAGVVYGAATEDMDCLTFGCPTLVRHLMAPASQNQAIQEFSLATLLQVRWGVVGAAAACWRLTACGK